MSDEILSRSAFSKEWDAIEATGWSWALARGPVMRAHDEALRADRDRLASRAAELEAALREVLDAILTPSDPDSDQLPVPEQTTEAPEHPDPERWPGTTERPWFVEGLTAMDRFRSRVIFFVGDSDQDRADLAMIVEAVNAHCPSAWTPEVEP